MIFHVVTIFPDFFDGILRNGVLGKAISAGAIQVRIHNLRDWAPGVHKVVDDRPFGGGEGMLMKCQPLFEAVESIWPERGGNRRAVLLSAQGPLFTQEHARKLVQLDELLLICGRYEGVDERVAEHLADEELSIGDFVLSGGELAAALVMDAVGRLVPGVVGNRESTIQESFRVDEESGRTLLDCPQYTRPAEFRGWKVPETLLGGNHAEIRKWRREASWNKTARNRPDLIERTSKESVP